MSAEDPMRALEQMSDEELERALEDEGFVDALEAPALLEALAGEEARLSEEEADAVFAAAWTPVATQANGARSAPALPQEPGVKGEAVEPPAPGLGEVIDLQARRSTWLRTLAIAAMVLIVPVGGYLSWMVYSGQESEPDERIKGSAQDRPRLQLHAFLGTLNQGQPVVERALRADDKLDEGDYLLFRYELDRPARLILLGQQGNGAVEELWSSAALIEAGDREIQAAGAALALEASHYSGAFRLMLIALPQGATLQASELPALREDVLAHWCARCAGSVLEFRR